MRKTFITAIASTMLLAATTAPAFAGGEPKNQWPFTRIVGERAPAGAPQAPARTQPAQGEPKNQLPFTRPVPEQTTIVLGSSGGFDWLDAGIGAAAGAGLALSLVGGALAVRGGRSTTTAVAR